MTGRQPTWNKFYRAWYDIGSTGTGGDDVDKSGWYEIHHKRNQVGQQE